MLHIQRQPSPPAPPLTAAAARNAVTATTRRGLDADSTRFVESLVTATPDGRFTVADAQLVAQTEQGFGATATGRSAARSSIWSCEDEQPRPALRGALIHLVADLEGVDLSAALAVVFDPTLRAASARDAEPGGVPAIRLGPTGFTNSQALVAEFGNSSQCRSQRPRRRQCLQRFCRPLPSGATRSPSISRSSTTSGRFEWSRGLPARSRRGPGTVTRCAMSPSFSSREGAPPPAGWMRRHSRRSSRL